MLLRTLNSPARPLYEIAREIRNDWQNPYFGAVPYIRAMFDLDTIDEMYGNDSAVSIVSYFLGNAARWRGPVARRIKAELNDMLPPRKK